MIFFLPFEKSETVDELDLEKFFDLSDEIQAQQERLGQLTELRCFINLMDLIIENLPQAVITTALMQISIEYARARILFKDQLSNFIQVVEVKTEGILISDFFFTLTPFSPQNGAKSLP